MFSCGVFCSCSTICILLYSTVLHSDWTLVLAHCYWHTHYVSLWSLLSFLLPDHFCPVCMEALTERYLTDCGHHLCYTCRGHLLASGRVECPECHKHNVYADARLNNHLKWQVNSLKIRCQHHEVGCQWVGEHLQEHLDPMIRKCGFILLTCPLGRWACLSSTMKDHMLSNWKTTVRTWILWPLQ